MSFEFCRSAFDFTRMEISPVTSLPSGSKPQSDGASNVVPSKPLSTTSHNKGDLTGDAVGVHADPTGLVEAQVLLTEVQYPGEDNGLLVQEIEEVANKGTATVFEDIACPPLATLHAFNSKVLMEGEQRQGFSINSILENNKVDGAPLVVKGSSLLQENKEEGHRGFKLEGSVVAATVDAVENNFASIGMSKRKGWKRRARAGLDNGDAVMVQAQLGKRDSTSDTAVGTLGSKKLKTKILENSITNPAGQDLRNARL
ncbi:hypothetical protein ACOSP7_032045 [Xanthoceras sorbifolium]